MALRQTTAQPSVEVNEFFLSICWGPEPQRRVYFYATRDIPGEPLVRRLCTLFTRKYGGAPSRSGPGLRFEYTPAGDLSDDDAFLVRDAIEAFAESARPTRHPCGEDDLADLLSLRGGTARRMIGRILFHQAKRWVGKMRRQDGARGSGSKAQGCSGRSVGSGKPVDQKKSATHKLQGENAEPDEEDALVISQDPDSARDRLRHLRQTFDRAVRRLEAIPETELSPSGLPFVQECADAMLAFAAWFGEQTPDDVAIVGNAYRVQYALGGLSGVIDWTALHWSVQFAQEIEQDVACLIEEADAFDKAVVEAFGVVNKPNEVLAVRRPLSDSLYNDLYERIERVSGLASRLGGRLQRLAVWASGGHTHRQPGDRSRAELGQQPVVSTDAPDGAAPHQASVELHGPGEPCNVLGKEKKPLTDAQYAVISRLLEAGTEGLSKDALEAVRPSARRILRNLRKDKDWAKVIRMPGQTNGRYRLKV